MAMTKNEPISVPDTGQERIVVVGGGFGGINLVRALRDSDYQVVLLDQNNFHQFQPLLYQVASCGLEADSIIFPLRKIVGPFNNVRFRMAQVEKIDPKKKVVHTSAGTLNYDRLVLATGSVSNFFGNDDLEKLSIGLKDIRESLDIRSQMLHNLERAVATTDDDEREALTNFVVVGGGPAGVETAGALAEFRSHILSSDFPDLITDMMKIYLVQSGDDLLKGMSSFSSDTAKSDLARMGVDLVMGNRVKTYDGLTVATDTGLELKSRCLVWTAGVKGMIPAGVDKNCVVRGDRIKVDRYSEIESMPGHYAIGDVACMTEGEKYPDGHPMVAPAAIQQAGLLGENLIAIQRDQPTKEYSYKDKGALATIGRQKAVAEVGAVKLRGFPAWLIWCFVHVASLVGGRGRLLVLSHWMASYFTYEKGNRFIVRNPPRK